MKKILVVIGVLCQTGCFAASNANSNSDTPNPKNLMIDQQDTTDIFAIPLDESNEDDNLQIQSMEAQQAQYFKTHPEAYKKWKKTQSK